jgi:double-stranded uracil-DNA glycosylase
MADVRSFAPVLRPDARILILGSMPGNASLAAQQYYAHPRNAFWPILCAWCGIDAQRSYDQRIEALLDARIGLWDVLGSCRRIGSLDAAIETTAAQPNAIAELLQTHAQIERICFNGASAASLYRRFSLPQPAGMELLRLPSTSPAHAGMPLVEKQRRWHQALA